MQKRKETGTMGGSCGDQPMKKVKKVRGLNFNIFQVANKLIKFKSNNAENKAPTETNANELLKKLDEHFLVKHPKSLLSFWEHALTLNQNSPTG